MYKRIGRPREKQGRAAAADVGHGKTGKDFVDNRPDTRELEQLQAVSANLNSDTAQLFDEHERFLERKKKREQRAIFEEFGHRHRNPEFDPDVEGQEQGGIHVPEGEAARPEDAPIVHEFRTSFHKLHSAKIYLEQNHQNLLTGFEASHRKDLKNLSLKERLFDIADKVKKESKAHKKRVKDLGTRTSIEKLNKKYARTVGKLGKEALALANKIQKYINKHSSDKSDLSKIHAEGTDIWRDTWKRAVLAVNTVLHGRWPYWKGQVRTWIAEKRDSDHLSYMDPAQVVGLDYIGSLARGYKGPPKQGVRFMPEKFDVDANLTAPPLAAYALTVGQAIIDRGRIWSKYAGPALFNGLLKPMEEDIQQHLEGAGLLDMGMDKNEPFEVVIDAEGVENLPHAPEEAKSSKKLSEKDLRIRNELHKLRSTDRKRFKRIGRKLKKEGFTATDKPHELLKAHDDQNQTYAFTNAQLDRIEKLIKDTP